VRVDQRLTQARRRFPVRAAVGPANTGTGSDGPAAAVSPNANLPSPVNIRFTDASTFDITDANGAVLSGGMACSPGADVSYNGWKVQISGDPAAGDVFKVAADIGATGDNSNALTLASLQNAKTTDGNFTFQGAYSSLVNQVGNKTREMEVTSAAADQSYSSQPTTRSRQCPALIWMKKRQTC
jgi:flagellar hook-associated protein 1 FlgK